MKAIVTVTLKPDVLDPQGKTVGVVFLRADVEHRRPGGVGDDQDLFGGFGGRGIGHGDQANAGPPSRIPA